MAGIYLHIPFCKRRCAYCDFFSTTLSGRMGEYVRALCRELEERRDYLEGELVQTIYFGGGTPSLLSEEQLRQIFTYIYKVYTVTPDAEITLEANPDDLVPTYLAQLRTLPFNRLSMGIQTFHDPTLQLLGRRHTASQAIRAYQRCREAGFANVSIDLMYGLPGQTPQLWETDLEQAIALHPEHLSAYHLTYEEGTPLWRLREEHRVAEADEELSLTFFELLTDRLAHAGYEHYEISNFCLPGFRSRHNSGYWADRHYLGCGASAHSYNGLSRQWNVSSLDAYISGILQGQSVCEVEPLDLSTRYNDHIITRLRTCEGLSLSHLREAFGDRLHAYCLRMAQPYLQRGLLVIEGDALRLSHRGIFLSDGIMSDLLWV